MPWNGVVGPAALTVLLAAWVFRRGRSKSGLGSLPDVGRPPAASTAMTEPQLDDTGLAAYSLPLQTRDIKGSE